MNKASAAVIELFRISERATQDQWVNRLHPLVKLIFTLAFLVACVSWNKYALAGVLLMGVYPIIMFTAAELSFAECARRIWVVLPLVVFIGIFNPLLDREVVLTCGSLAITGGMLSCATLIFKGIWCVLAAYLLIATTTIEAICAALRQLHVPAVLCTQILLTFRYISVLLGEVGRTIDAYSLRAPGQRGINLKAWGPLAGQILLRSIDRANELYESMTLRGFTGEFPQPPKR